MQEIFDCVMRTKTDFSSAIKNVEKMAAKGALEVLPGASQT